MQHTQLLLQNGKSSSSKHQNMAATDDITTVNSSMHEEDDDVDHANDDDFDQHHRRRSLPRLSTCTSYYDDDDDDDGDGDKMVTRVSQTPLGEGKLKDYYNCSKEEVKCGRRITRKNTRGIGERWVERAKKYEAMENINNNNSKGIGDREWILMMTKPKGGRKSVCVDIDEIKACRDLGFELKHDPMVFDLPRTHSTLAMETSSEGSSPVATWRISSPGDDPRDVKARLRAWAQAVALASAACLNG